MARLYELAVLGISLIVVGATLVAPSVPVETRIAIIGAILAGMVLISRTRRPPGE